jgi:predicted ATPase
MQFRLGVKRTCYNTMYPFFHLSGIGLERLDFEPLTILHGGNGSGKTTVLNVIAEKLRLQRETPFNRSSFFQQYADMCETVVQQPVPAGSRVIVSDDVFDYMLTIRSLNEGIDRQRTVLLEEHHDARQSVFQVRSLDDYDELKKRNSARRLTQSAFVRQQLSENVREMSNGESANFFFRQRIDADALYLLDEPENSLSPEGQAALAAYLAETVRCMDCQLVISTHSPFLLAVPGAKIYDMDARPVDIKPWHELGEVRAYASFFRTHRHLFDKT